MGALHGAELAGGRRRQAGQGVEPLRLGVEGGLEVLERQCEVQDRRVVGGGVLRGGGGGQRASAPAPAIAMKAAARAEGAHVVYPACCRLAVTCSAVIGSSVGSLAGGLPTIVRIQAACRASTDTTSAAAARLFGVRFAACPLYAATPRSSRVAAAAANASLLANTSPNVKVGAGVAFGAEGGLQVLHVLALVARHHRREVPQLPVDFRAWRRRRRRRPSAGTRAAARSRGSRGRARATSPTGRYPAGRPRRHR